MVREHRDDTVKVARFDETMDHLIGQEITVVGNRTVDPRDGM